MTRPVTTWPATAREFLLEEDAGAAVDVLGRELSEHHVGQAALGGVRRLTGPARGAVDREIAAVAAELLDVDLLDVLVSAWRTYADMTLAARSTLAVPGSEELVVLAAHRAVWAYRPHIDLFVDDKQVATVEFDVRLTFDLRGVVAVVGHGDLLALRGGACTLTGTLIGAGQLLAQQQRGLDLALVVAIDPPIPLLGEAAGHVA